MLRVSLACLMIFALAGTPATQRRYDLLIKPERPHRELFLSKLRPGDIYTHMYRPFDPVLDENGKVQPYLFEAQKRGIIFDVGHGGGSLVSRYAVPAMKQGYAPDSISTDLHTGSMNAGMKDIQRLACEMTLLGGNVMWDLNGRGSEPWETRTGGATR